MIAIDAGQAWSAWAEVTPVLVAAERGTFASVRLPITVSPDADGRFPDLRVIDDSASEVPYAIDPDRLPIGTRDVGLQDNGFVARLGTEATIDLGKRAPAVDSLTIATDIEGRPTYLERVAVDASNDRRRWTILRRDAIVYRVAEDEGKGSQTITFSATHARWLRVRVLDPREPFPLTGASVSSGHTTQPALVPLPLLAVSKFDPVTHRQIWTFDAQIALRPSGVAFDEAPGTFERPVRIESSDDGKAWSFAGDGTIARYSDGTEETAFAFPEDTAREWRVVVENGNDAPLADTRPTLLGVPHTVVFAAVPGHRYRLLSGNPAAVAPSYDLGDRLAHASWKAVAAHVDETQANAGFRDARALAQRYPWLLGALGALGLLAFTISVLRTLRSERTSGEAPK